MEKYHKQDVTPIEKENERDGNYKSDNPQIDSERTRNNYRFTPHFGKTYTEFINGRIKELGLSPRKDAVVMNSFVLGSDKTFFDRLAKVEQYNFFSDCYKFFAERYGEDNIIAAVVHNDETTPHMHLNLMPVTKDGRLCCKQLFDKPQLQQLQTDFYETVGKRWGLQRGKEGSQKKHLASVPPLGYKKDPENKEKWIINEKGAEIVREIFKLCVQGFGPTQIARILTERGIDTPAVYLHKNGLPTALKLNERSNIWSPTSIGHILADVSYLGHTVNFKFHKKSYKSSRRIQTKKEDWVIFEDTQEAIIDKQTFETVQKIRQAKRRPTDMGEMSPLSGLVYCADCGKKMYLCRCSTTKQKEFFNCSSYRKQLKKTCTSHHITVEALAVLIQDDLRRTIYFAQQQREMFLQTLRKNAATRTEKELKEYSKELRTSEERIERLDKIIESLYEDKVEGKISEERYLKMSDTYETEQAGLKEQVKMLRSEIAKAKEDDDKILDFMMLIYKYNSFEELTPEILRAFIEKVVVHEKTKVDGHYRQTVEIFYNFVGAIDRPIWGDELNDEDD